MESFKTFKSTVAVIDRDNIDTDQIIPKEYLKSISRSGFGPALFAGWRYLDDGSENPDFELNQPDMKDAGILIVGNNFGCGSSREHAVWALQQYGIVCVIAPFRIQDLNKVSAFGDIFKSNACKNGLLTIEVSPEQLDELKLVFYNNPQSKMTVNLEEQTFYFVDVRQGFEIDPTEKQRLIQGLDEIGVTLLDEQAISDFEHRHEFQKNW